MGKLSLFNVQLHPAKSPNFAAGTRVVTCKIFSHGLPSIENLIFTFLFFNTPSPSDSYLSILVMSKQPQPTK